MTGLAASALAVVLAIPATQRLTPQAAAPNPTAPGRLTPTTAFGISAASDDHGAITIGPVVRGGDPAPAPVPTPSPTPDPTSPPALPPIPAPTAPPAPSAPPAPAPAAGPFFGLLETDGSHAGAEQAAGVTVATLSLGWDAYERSPGVYDEGYAASMRSKMAQMQAAGQKVTLDAGLQYPPSWIFNVDGSTRFVDQYGDVWHGNLSEDVPDAVFDSNVRNAEADYIAHVAKDFGDSFFAIRAGGLLMNELRYPQSTYNGHRNCYWAFDGNARASSPVPGWVPGEPDATKAGAFLSWYTQSLTDFQNWLVGTYRSHFSAWIAVLYPSWGLRPGDADAAVARNLDGSTNPADWGTLEMGLDWSKQVGSLTDGHVIVYTSWLDRGDDGATPQTMSPARYLMALARAKGLPVAGENSGGNTPAEMAATVGRARSLGLIGMWWLGEPQLLAGDQGTSLAGYHSLIG